MESNKMKIIALAENTAINENLKKVHGLGIYIETPMHKLMFDLGPDDTAFENAAALGIDLAEVDTVIISHGHYDHGRGLDRFLKENEKAKVYARKQAFGPLFAKAGEDKKFIGLDAEIAGNERIVFTGDELRIDDELFLFSDVEAALDTESSRAQAVKGPDGFVQDDYSHEQNLILTAEGMAVLFSGCAHCGIEGILDTALRYDPDIQAVFGGFHLFNPNNGATEPLEYVQSLAERLSVYDLLFYTCHCTGEKAYRWMSEIMGDKLKYLSTGLVVDL